MREAVVRAVRRKPLRSGDLTGELFSSSSGQLLSRIGHLPPSDVELELLRPSLRSRFLRLDMAAPAQEFLRRHPPMGALGNAVCRMTDLCASSMHLGLYAMQLLTCESASCLLREGGARFGTYVDVGAGPGYVSEPLVGLFRAGVATELSLPCCWRLRARGIRCVHGQGLPADVARHVRRVLGLRPSEGADVVAALNVLDRCARPYELLGQMRELAAKPGGRVLLALRLPLEQYVVSPAGAMLPAEEALPVGPFPGSDTGNWERSLDAFAGFLEADMGLVVERFSRVPYLCQGEHDVTLPFTALDDVVMVCRPM